MDAAWATARTWAEVDLDTVAANYHSALAELGPGVLHYCVLKANAYGLGAVALGRRLLAEGARQFAVACAAEALELRRALGGDCAILVMGVTMPPEVEAVIGGRITPTVTSLAEARRLSEMAVRRGVTVPVHCKVDTGLNRLGMTVAEAPAVIAEIVSLPGLSFEGLYSHLQRRSPEHDRLQARRLLTVRDALIARGVRVPLLHLLDSIGMWRYPESQFDAVRGAAYLVGHTPQDYARPEALRLAISLYTRIVRIHDVPAGECLGYDDEHPLPTPRRVATLCVGYADGYPREMSHVGEVEIHGRRAKVLGTVCMDLMMADVSGVPQAAVGDVVTLLGGSIDIWTYTGFYGGYNNLALSQISRRVPRVYLQGGKPAAIADGIGLCAD